MKETYGKGRRGGIMFNLDDETDRKRYQFSYTINLNDLVKRALDREMKWQENQKKGGVKIERQAD